MKTSKDFSSRREWEKFLWENFLEYLHKSSNKKILRKKLETLFSEHERGLALRRLTALILIKDGLSYAEIGNILWIAPATISALKKSGNSGYPGRKNKPKDPRRWSVTAEARAPKPSETTSVLEDLLVGILEGYSNPRKRWEFLDKNRQG